MRAHSFNSSDLLSQACAPSSHVCSLLLLPSSHLPAQLPPRAQQLSLPVSLMPHFGHLVVLTTPAVVVVAIAVSGVVDVTIPAFEVGKPGDNGVTSKKTVGSKNTMHVHLFNEMIRSAVTYLDKPAHPQTTCVPCRRPHRRIYLPNCRREHNN